MLESESSEMVFKTPYLEISKDNIVDEEGLKYEYWVEHRSDAVMIIPVRVDLSEPKYVLVEQYRYPVGMVSLEFPAGKREKHESMRDAAVRELKQEIGLEALHLKLLYTTFENSGRSKTSLAIYLAVVQGEPTSEFVDRIERSSGLTQVQLTTAALHKKVLNNAIVDQATLSAVAVMIMQNPKASEYLDISSSAQNKETNA